MKKLYVLIIPLLLLPNICLGAIAYDAQSTLATAQATSSRTVAHTCTGDNRILFIGVYNQSFVTSVTYAGSAATKIDGVDEAGLWYIVAPASGSNNIVVNFSGAQWVGIHATSYTGASQTGQPDASNKVTGTATSLTASVTTVADNSWLVGFFRNQFGNHTAGTNTTLRTTQSGQGVVTGDSNGDQTPAGSHSLATSWGGSAVYSAVVASFAPASAPAPATPTATTHPSLSFN